jgi:hypothetical protein
MEAELAPDLDPADPAFQGTLARRLVERKETLAHLGLLLEETREIGRIDDNRT